MSCNRAGTVDGASPNANNATTQKSTGAIKGMKEVGIAEKKLDKRSGANINRPKKHPARPPPTQRTISRRRSDGSQDRRGAGGWVAAAIRRLLDQTPYNIRGSSTDRKSTRL